MGKVLFKCPVCSGTEDFVFREGQLACLCSIEKADDLPAFVDDPPADYDLVEVETDSTLGLGKPFSG